MTELHRFYWWEMYNTEKWSTQYDLKSTQSVQTIKKIVNAIIDCCAIRRISPGVGGPELVHILKYYICCAPKLKTVPLEILVVPGKDLVRFWLSGTSQFFWDLWNIYIWKFIHFNYFRYYEVCSNILNLLLKIIFL